MFMDYLYTVVLRWQVWMMWNGDNRDFQVCVESYLVSIILNWLRSPHAIPISLCHEFHRVERVTVMIRIERFHIGLTWWTSREIIWVDHGLKMCVVFSCIDWVEWFPMSDDLKWVSEPANWQGRVSSCIKWWSDSCLTFIWGDMMGFTCFW